MQRLAIMKCKELQFGDWVTDEHGFPMQIIIIGNDYAYATWEGNEGDPWEFNDKNDQPESIPLTARILEKNGWWFESEDMWHHEEADFSIEKWKGRFQCCDINQIKLDSVHQLQQALRLCGLDELADNFKL